MAAVPPESRPRARRRPVAVLATLLVLALLAGAGYLWQQRRQTLDQLQQESLLPNGSAMSLVVPQDAQGNLINPNKQVLSDDQGQPIDATTMHIDAQGQVVDAKERPMLWQDTTALPRLADGQAGQVLMGVKSNALAQPKKGAGNSLNFLMIGEDKAQGGTSRSDVIVVAHISDDRKRVDLVHVPRDLYVTIPGAGKNKVNAAYAEGGSKLLVQTLEPLLGVPIDHVARIDFEGFKNMTDALGGIDLPVDGQRVHMDGEQALRWVRERKTLNQGDISRGQRQMQFMRAVMMGYLGHRNVNDAQAFATLVDVTSKNMVVDDGLSPEELQKLAYSLRDVNGENLKMWTAPWTSAGPGPHGMSVVWPADDQMKVLAEHLSTDTMASYVDDVSPKSGFGG